jgi:cyclic beta-1,2-glucan synthetase
LFEHCALALDLAMRRTGTHGLPLMLGGDWNDGMNRVGAAGSGESVWLGWFLGYTLDLFSAVAGPRADPDRLTAWRAHRLALKEALERAGWDGTYYRRAYYDDGTPLGTASAEECRIDSIAQSWSVLSGLGDRERGARAMDAVLAELVDANAEVIKLFTPPFTSALHDPGYIAAYPPGVRENGGQYTHAAAWVVYALARLGRGDQAYTCFNMVNPISHSRDRAAAATYRVEPYVAAADIYTEDERRGRGGWTWYTGAAGWLQRAAVEGILGIRLQRGRLLIRPALPSAWDGFRVTLRHAGVEKRICVSRSGERDYEITVDGQRVDDAGTGIDLNR